MFLSCFLFHSGIYSLATKKAKTEKTNRLRSKLKMSTGVPPKSWQPSHVSFETTYYMFCVLLFCIYVLALAISSYFPILSSIHSCLIFRCDWVTSFNGVSFGQMLLLPYTIARLPNFHVTTFEKTG